MAEKQLETLVSLFQTDTMSTNVRTALARAYAAANRFDDAKAMIRPVAAEMPDNLEVLSLLWRIQIASRDWKEALNTGEIIMSIDSSAATADFFERMISIAESAAEPGRAVALADRREHHQPHRDDAIDRDEGDNGEAEPRLGLDVAIDVLAVEQRAQRALPAGFAALRFHRCRHDAHRATFGCGMLPVVSEPGSVRILAIGSVVGGGGNGRSGKASNESNCVDCTGLSFK